MAEERERAEKEDGGERAGQHGQEGQVVGAGLAWPVTGGGHTRKFQPTHEDQRGILHTGMLGSVERIIKRLA
jgi:hypothetical protein